ncbi:hypothetical protein D3875_04055 [Deinococcus cavernae]|uniref:Uncharacterized protein n=1 Tax=Deinococcus cavernae TaxID=2320857 RepID=A0A418VEC9_9DEIO|nr:hypothetical protein [Deinococcus cavernae]RJF74460.1 hypothetical protein D3875_04055 [Deinococcus cavernae]
MTRSSDAELNAYRAMAAAEIRAYQGVMFRHSGTFVKTQNGREREYPCRFSVIDPVKADRNTIAAADTFGRGEGVAFVDVRLLKVHPEDRRPPEGSVLSRKNEAGQWEPENWDGGRLEVRRWSQASDFTGQAVGLCHIRR